MISTSHKHYVAFSKCKNANHLLAFDSASCVVFLLIKSSHESKWRNREKMVRGHPTITKRPEGEGVDDFVTYRYVYFKEEGGIL